MEYVNLADGADTIQVTLAGKKQACCARAQYESSILLCDEAALSALDPETTSSIFALEQFAKLNITVSLRQA